MKKITAFNIDKTAMVSNIATSKRYQVLGDPGAEFSMIVNNDSGLYYNFPENTVVSVEEGSFRPAASFSSTTASLINKTIPETGVYEGIIDFPVIADDDYYIIKLFANNATTEFVGDNFQNKHTYIEDKIYKYLNTTLTFSLTHSNAAVVEPSSYTATGVSTQVRRINNSNKFSIKWDFTLSSSYCTILRQPRITDFEFDITKTTVTAGSSSTRLELNSVKGITVGMVAAATGIAAGTKVLRVIKGYKNEGKSSPSKSVYTVPIKINSDSTGTEESEAGTVILDTASTFVVDRTVTFTGGGSKAANAYNNTKFKVTNFKAKLDDVVTTTTAAVPDTVIHCTSANGIKPQAQYTVNGATTSSNTVVVDEVITNLAVGQRLQALSSGSLVGIPEVVHVDTANKRITLSKAQTLSDGITLTFSNSIVKGIGIKNATKDPYVVSISTNDVTVNANQDIESGATVTFVGSSRSGTITADVEILQYGDNNLTLDLTLDNILKVG